MMKRLTIYCAMIALAVFAACRPGAFRHLHTSVTVRCENLARGLVPKHACAWLDGHLAYWLTGHIRNRQIVQGEGGWLFYLSPFDGFSRDDYIGKVRPSEERIKLFLDRFGALQTALSAMGCPLVLLVPPNKENVYPEKMPDSIRRFSSVSQSDVLLECLKTNSNITVINLKEPLIKMKSHADLYYPLDTHWNLYGASVGVAELIGFFDTTLGREFLNRPLQSRPIVQRTDELARMSRMTDIYKEHPNEFALLNTPQFDLRDIQKRQDGMLEFRNDNSWVRKRVLITGDSFRVSMLPALNDAFQWVYVGDHLNDKQIIAEVKRYHPDLAVVEIVERYVH